MRKKISLSSNEKLLHASFRKCNNVYASEPTIHKKNMIIDFIRLPETNILIRKRLKI